MRELAISPLFCSLLPNTVATGRVCQLSTKNVVIATEELHF